MTIHATTTIKELRELLRAKEISPREVADGYLRRCKAYDGKLEAFLELYEPSALEFSHADHAPLYGIPGAIKDNICQKGHKATCASKILENFVAPYDATSVARLKAAGATMLGRANCDEFAMGSSGETSAFQKTKNPWDLTRVPGGSCSGSAAAVAAGLVPWAIGSDTGGSVRQPAALCGVVGSKPTYGLISRYGLIALASSLDTIGVMTRTVYDNAVVVGAMVGADGKDSTALPLQGPYDYTPYLTGKVKPGLKIGVVTNAVHAKGIDAGVKKLLEQAIADYKHLGAQIVELALPTMDYGAAVYFMINRAEAASNLARFDGVRYGYRDKDAETLSDMYEKTRGAGFGREVIRRILTGNYVLSVGHAEQYYASACTVQRMMRAEFVAAFKSVDLLFFPVSPAPAFKIGALDNDPLQMALEDYFTCPINIVKMPAVSVPCGFVDGMPVAFQLVGPDCSEGLIFQTCHAYEQMHDWYKQVPEWVRA
jgi:aspartyl-tRNA(Asn)/glutamyl-tRNA(Gln) amidotransferase subunit A